MYASSLYHINKKIFHEEKFRHYPPSTTKIKKIFGVDTEIQLKYKRIKWNPSGNASLLCFRGIVLYTDKLTS